MLHVAIFFGKKINDHIDDDRTNSGESASVLRRNSRGNIVNSASFACEKDKLHYSKYGSTKHENMIRWERSSVEVNLKRAMMDNQSGVR